VTTLAQLRQALGYDLREYHTGTIAAPTTTTFVDSELVDSGESGDRWVGAWVLVLSGTQAGSLRRVASYDEETGQLTLTRSWTAPSAGDTYEMHTLLSPADLTRCINQALGKCYHRTQEDVTAVSGQRQYALASYTWLTHPSQVTRVEWRVGDANQYHYYPLTWWEVHEDDGVLTLEVEPAGTGTYVLHGFKPYEALADDDDATSCPLEWVKAGAEYEVYQWLSRTDPAQDASRWKQQQQEAALRFFELARRYQPRAGLKVQHRDSPWRSFPSETVLR
jgi:hypothetical protein